MIKKLSFICLSLLIHLSVFASDYDAERARKKACIVSRPGDLTKREKECERYRLELDVWSLTAFCRLMENLCPQT